MPVLRIHFRISLLVLLLAPGTVCHAVTGGVVEEIVLQRSTDDLPEIKNRKQLRALVTYGRPDFTILPNGEPSGVQVELLRHFEKMINKGIKRAVDKTEVVLVPTTHDRLLGDLNAGRGDIAAALMIATPERLQQASFVTDGVMTVNEVIVTHADVEHIASLEELSGRTLHVTSGSHYVERLEALNQRFRSAGKAPVVIVEMDPYLTEGDLLEMVDTGMITATVMNDFVARLWAKVLPDIRVKEELVVHSGTQIGWAVRKNNPKLKAALQQFRKKVRKGTLLGNILFRKYFDSVKAIRNPTAESERSKFQRVIGIFERYSEQYQYDVLAAVAQAYQESQLDHSRVSHRGAVGIMQVLPTTAADPNINIADIEQLENNIHAGVKYLAFIRDRYFSDTSIGKKNQLAFSWAAYNAGPANVRKMREKTAAMGLDPDIWFGNVEMAAAKIVGNETVSYVRNIFKYYIAYRLVRENLNDQPRLISMR